MCSLPGCSATPISSKVIEIMVIRGSLPSAYAAPQMSNKLTGYWYDTRETEEGSAYNQPQPVYMPRPRAPAPSGRLHQIWGGAATDIHRARWASTAVPPPEKAAFIQTYVPKYICGGPATRGVLPAGHLPRSASSAAHASRWMACSECGSAGHLRQALLVAGASAPARQSSGCISQSHRDWWRKRANVSAAQPPPTRGRSVRRRTHPPGRGGVAGRRASGCAIDGRVHRRPNFGAPSPRVLARGRPHSRSVIPG